MIKIIEILQSEMERPTSYGWFHILWVIISLLVIIYLLKTKKNENKLNKILLIYGLISLLLEIIKQVIWSYDNGVWDYQWYAFPFQLCTTPIYVSLLYLITKNKKIKESLLSYLAFFSILGGLATIIYPETCFTKTIEVNIHTMFLHCGGFVVSIYLLFSNYFDKNIKSFIDGFKIFIIFALIALILNVTLYNSGILNGETFDMFFISPYFISTLPVFNIIQQKVSYPLFLLIYLIIVFTGGIIIYEIQKQIERGKLWKKK